MNYASWSETSRRDLRRAFEYYRLLDGELALPIVGTIEAKAAWLADYPGTGAPFRRRLRKSLVAGTPYLIPYQEETGGIAIIRVRHAAENWHP